MNYEIIVKIIEPYNILSALVVIEFIVKTK